MEVRPSVEVALLVRVALAAPSGQVAARVRLTALVEAAPQVQLAPRVWAAALPQQVGRRPRLRL